MKIEKITENKIRFFLNLEDLKSKNIDYHDFMSNSIESQDLFMDMLDTAEKEIGFNTKNYKLMLEAVATSDGNFILTVTRISPDTEKTKYKKVKIQRKSYNPTKSICVYKFDSFDVFCDFCKYLHSSKLKTLESKLKNSSFYKYDNSYYLILRNMNISIEKLKNLHIMLTEFSTLASTLDLFENKLIEFGEAIIKDNAINIGIKFF